MPVEEPVKDAGEGEHGEERGVEVAGVLVALDALVAPAHPRHVGHLMGEGGASIIGHRLYQLYQSTNQSSINQSLIRCN